MVIDISQSEKKWKEMGTKARVAWLKNRVNELGDFNQAWAELLLFFEAEYKQVKGYNQEARNLLKETKTLMGNINSKLERIEKALGICKDKCDVEEITVDQKIEEENSTPLPDSESSKKV